MLKVILANRDTTYYNVQLVLIVSALVLQVWTGLLSMYIVWLRRYYVNNKEDLLSDCGKMCCPCKCKRKRLFANIEEGWMNNNVDQKDTYCCPWKCKSNMFTSHEQEVMHAYELLTQRLLKVQLQHYKTKDKREEIRMLQNQEQILKAYLDELQVNCILRRSVFLQHLLSAIVFIVSIMNAVIIGLGIDEIVNINGTEYKVHKTGMGSSGITSWSDFPLNPIDGNFTNI